MLLVKKIKKFLRRANELGINIAISTGRIFASAKIYANITGVKSPLICSNGLILEKR